MKKKIVSIGIIILAITIIVIIATQTNSNIVNYKLKANVTKLRINNSQLLLGISNDQAEFNFGIVPENISVKKVLNLRNNENSDSIIKISIIGNISDYIKVEEENLILKSKENKQIVVTFNATNIGYYTGNMKIYITVPKYEFLAFLHLWRL